MFRFALPLIMAVSSTILFACPDHKKEYDGKLKADIVKAQGVTDDGSPMHYPKTKKPMVKTLKITIPSGGETGWHYHPYPGYGYTISGTMEVTLKDGQKNRYEAEEAIYEVVNTAHNGRCISKTPCDLIVTFTGVENEPITVMLPQKKQ
ncbi:cupin domain-containing protein [Endozoicomonas elysicola]|uniref:cupin domain-containing protein n=1 Tax=Endozoicomonas elysicola TaxID=305900 RepID=UPI00037427FE|nr:cupin domain-containing protein [Endozoicomonas elysicola]